MIDTYTAILCAFMLFVAAVLEIIAMKRGSRMTGFLGAFGFAMLGARFAYLIYAEELARLNIYGTGSIGAIALARIMACAEELRK